MPFGASSVVNFQQVRCSVNFQHQALAPSKRPWGGRTWQPRSSPISAKSFARWTPCWHPSMVLHRIDRIWGVHRRPESTFDRICYRMSPYGKNMKKKERLRAKLSMFQKKGCAETSEKICCSTPTLFVCQDHKTHSTAPWWTWSRFDHGSVFVHLLLTSVGCLTCLEAFMIRGYSG